MRERFLLAIGTPMFIIFGYPALMKADTPTYYSYVSIAGIILIFSYFFVKARRKKRD